MIIAGGYARYPIIIPINTMIIVEMYVSSFPNANCSAMFAGSDCLRYFAINVDSSAVTIKLSPYMNCGKNRLKFPATNVVRYGRNENTNNVIPIDQITLWSILFTMLKRLLL